MLTSWMVARWPSHGLRKKEKSKEKRKKKKKKNPVSVKSSAVFKFSKSTQWRPNRLNEAVTKAVF